MATELLVCTQNLRLDLAIDGKNRFWERFIHLPDYWKKLDCDVFGFQEVTPPMFAKMQAAMPEYRLIGDFRSPGSEACPIAFRINRFREIEARTIWLTNTPTIPSKDEESKYPRVATILTLETLNHEVVQIANVHLDYASEAVAFRQIDALVKSLDWTVPTIVMGDFNVSKASTPCRRLESLGMDNVIRRFALEGATFHNFTDHLEGDAIDHLFVSNGLTAMQAWIDRSRPPQGYYSDHDPIIARLKTTA